MEKVRIQKYISDCGLASRRRAEEDIKAGLVKINGKICEIGQKIDPDTDVVFYKEKRCVPIEEKVYIKLNKPRGYVTTLSDEKGRKCVADLVKDVGVRVYPAGRLDLDSEGLLILTNDGEVANRLMHPSGNFEKMYIVKVRSIPSDEQMLKLNGQMVIEDYKIKPCRVIFADDIRQNKLVFYLTEGRNRQIRKMCDKVGLEVTRLKRVKEGKISLGNLRSGKWERLEEKEIQYLKKV